MNKSGQNSKISNPNPGKGRIHLWNLSIHRYLLFFYLKTVQLIGSINKNNLYREPKKQPFFRFVILDDEKPSSKCGDCKSSTSDVIKCGNSDVIKTGKDESEPTRYPVI